MSLYKIPYQNLEIPIPDDGEVFRWGDSIAKRVGNQLFALSGGVYGPHASKLDVKSLKDYSGSPLQSLAGTAFQAAGPGQAFFESKDVTPFLQNKPQASETITQNVKADNPNGITVTSDKRGTLFENKAAPTQTLSKAPDGEMAVSGALNLSSDIASLPDLAPGMKGENVKKLQTWLIGQGFAIPAGATGTYGDQTKAAVAAWQQKNGIDTKGNPGFFGPLSRSFLAGGAGSASTPGGSGAAGTTPASSGSVLPDTRTQEDDQFEALLAQSTLPGDYKELIRSSYTALATNDAARVNRMIEAFNSATKFSDPYFKASIRVATDALSRGISAIEGDLEFKEKQQRDSLKDLEANIAASKDFLTLEQANDLRKLATSYKTDLETTQTDMAARGLTGSTIRSKTESILNENYEGLVASSNRQFGSAVGKLDRDLAASRRDTPQNIEYYRKLAAANKLDLLRKTEASVGSPNLPGYADLLGGQGGEIPRRQVTDALSFANSFVF